MWSIDQNICEWAQGMDMAHGIDDYIARVKKSEEAEVSAGRSSADQTADQGQCAQPEMAHVHKCGHAEKTKHLSVRGHDPGNIVKRIHGEEEHGVCQRALLDRGKSFEHAQMVT